MAMMLKPPKGQAWLEVEDVILRIRAEFPRVQVATDGVAEHVESLAKGYRDTGLAAIADRIEGVKGKAAWVMVLGGDPAADLILLVLPQFPLMVGFGSETHLEHIQPLLKRCSTALGYELR